MPNLFHFWLLVLICMVLYFIKCTYRGEIQCIIFNMRHFFIGYHIVDYFHIVPLDLDFNTSGNTITMIFWFLESNITYILIIIIFPNTLWYGIWFTLETLLVVNCGSYWQCGTHALWVTEGNLLPHVVSASVFFYYLSLFLLF